MLRKKKPVTGNGWQEGSAGESLPDNPKVDIIDKNGIVRSIVVYSSVSCGTVRRSVSWSITMSPSASGPKKP